MSNFFRQRLLRKTVCSLMAGIIGFTQTSVVLAGTEAAASNATNSQLASGNSLQSIGKEASSYGKDLANKASTSLPTWNGAGFSYQFNGETVEVTKDSLAPKASGSLKYKYSQADIDKQGDMSTDGKAIQAAGMGAMDNLNTETTEESELTIEAQVYQIMSSMASNPRADLSEATFLKQTQEIMDDLQNVLKDLVSCDADSALNKKTVTKHVPDLKLCQQVVDRSSTCTVDHNYTAGVIEHSDGPFNLKSCGDGCMELWIGRVGDNYWGGSCAIYEQWTQVRVRNPQAVIKATFEYAKWDDYMMVYVGNPGEEELIWTGPYDWRTNPNYFPPETPGKCELSTSWWRNLDVDVTDAFRNAKDNDLINFKIRASVTGGGEAYGRIRITYDTSQVITSDIWIPKDCVEAAIGVTDGMSTGSVKCTAMPERDSEGCTFIAGVKICPNNLAESPIPTIPNLCKKVEVTSNFHFYKGDTGCWNALVGFNKDGKAIYEEVCGGENLGGNLDTCKKYEEDENCVFMSSECTPGMQGASGTCYVNDVVYDCGKDFEVDDVTADTTYKCQGVSCVGEECIDVERTYNTNFARVNALLNALQYMAQDMTCDGLDEDGNPIGNQNVVCSVFKGKPGTCKIAVGGWQDCCENPQNAGVGSYISMMTTATAAHVATTTVAENVVTMGNGIEFADKIAGQYADMWQGLSDVAGTVVEVGKQFLQDNFSSLMDNIYSFADYIGGALDWVKEQVINKLKEYLAEQMKKILSELGLDGLIGGTGGAGTTTAGVQMAAQAATYVMAFVAWVYLAYQIANLIIQIVYKCEEDEYAMLSKRDAGNCHYIGSYCDQKKLGFCILKKRAYCCYDSPLSRIISEQVRLTQPEVLEPYGVSTFGTPEDPKCVGIPIEAIDKINWDLINLDEWTALLESTGNSSAANVSLENLTGAGSKINWTENHGRFDDWNPPVNSNVNTASRAMQDEAAVMTMSLDDVVAISDNVTDNPITKSRTTRQNTVERVEEKLTGINIDKVRNSTSRCITLQIGNNISVRGDCAVEEDEETKNELICTRYGEVIDCELLAKFNAYEELHYWTKPQPGLWEHLGYKCTLNSAPIDCSSISSEEGYKAALEEHASNLKGSTYKDRYVCTSIFMRNPGNYNVCERAIQQSSCGCWREVPFRCYDGNKPISCSALGTIPPEDCECK